MELAVGLGVDIGVPLMGVVSVRGVGEMSLKWRWSVCVAFGTRGFLATILTGVVVNPIPIVDVGVQCCVLVGGL